MSLFDLDKHDDRRREPRPNQNDQVVDRLAHGTTQNHNSIDEAEADGLKFKERQILAKQTGFNKAVFGFLEADNKFGLKVAKDGFDVLTATDEELVFNSEQNVFKIVSIINTSTVSTTASTAGAGSGQVVGGSTVVAHGLGYIPVVVAVINNGTNFNTLPAYFPTAGSDWIGGYNIRVVADSVNLTVTTTVHIYGGAGHSLNAGVQLVKCYLLQETAN